MNAVNYVIHSCVSIYLHLTPSIRQHIGDMKINKHGIPCSRNLPSLLIFLLSLTHYNQLLSLEYGLCSDINYNFYHYEYTNQPTTML